MTMYNYVSPHPTRRLRVETCRGHAACQGCDAKTAEGKAVRRYAVGGKATSVRSFALCDECLHEMRRLHHLVSVGGHDGAETT